MLEVGNLVYIYDNLQSIQRMTTSPDEKPTPLAEKVASVRRRRTAASSRLHDG